ncbi:MAG: hypothetical protein ACOH2B_09290 [Burkholderiaceae bacterium]
MHIQKLKYFLAGGLLAGSCLAHASEPLVLSNADMDSISAGAVIKINNLDSVGAFSYSYSSATVTPALKVIVSASVSTQVGLKTTGFTQTYSVKYYP